MNLLQWPSAGAGLNERPQLSLASSTHSSKILIQRMGKFFHSLRFRLLCLVVLALVPPLTLSLYGNWRFRRSEQREWQERGAEAMNFVNRQEKDLFQNTHSLLGALSRFTPVNTNNLRRWKPVFEDLLHYYPYFKSWGLARTNGEVLFSQPENPALRNVASQLCVQRALRSENLVAGGYQPGPISGTPGFSFACRILDQAGQPSGVLFVELDSDWFINSALHLQSMLPAETSFTQVDEHGAILVAYPASRTWRDKQLPPALFTNLLNTPAGQIHQTTDPAGRPLYCASCSMQSPVNGCRVFYLLSVPKAVLLDKVNQSLTRSLLVLGLTTALAMAVAWLGGDWLVVRRTQTLVESVSRIEAGDLSTRSGQTGGMTELDRLAQAFDHMALTLQERDQQRKRVEENLRESEQKYRALFDNTAVGVFLAKDGVLVDCNEQACRLLGYSRTEIIGRRPRELFPPTQPNGRSSLEVAMEQTKSAEAGMPQSFYWQGRRKDGSLIDTEATLQPLAVQGQSLWLATLHDITEIRQAERALRELSGRLLQLQDEERRHIARELHDHTAQWLAALSMNLSALETPDSGLRPQSRQVLLESQKLLQQCLTEVRTLSYLLHPPLLEELGLSGAIEEYAAGFSKRSGIQVHVQALPDLSSLPRETGLALFRVLQECLANIHRHSGSAYAYIRLMQNELEIKLEVCDTGHGMAASAATDSAAGGLGRSFGVGITGMRERLRQLGGSLEIDSSNQGTTVRARVPHRQNKA